MDFEPEKISLLGNPPYAILIRGQPWDISAFRPDPLQYMNPNKFYFANVVKDIENLPSGQEVKIPRKIFISKFSVELVNIR